MDHRDFEELQPHEFMQKLEGYRWRQENDQNMRAYFVACQMSVHTKKPVSPKDLLKPFRNTVKQQKKTEDTEYLRKRFKLQ